jgi:hypothetical protein
LAVVFLLRLILLVHEVYSLPEELLLIVKLILEGQEVLIQRNAVSKKSLVSRCFVLLVDFSTLEFLDLVLQDHNLLLQVPNEFVLQLSILLILLVPLFSLLLLVVLALQV